MSDYPASLPIQQFFDDNGAPLAGGKLYSYVAGTSTLQSTYADASGTPNANPIILDASGRATYYLPTGVGYKFNLTDANGVQVTGYPVDNVSLPTPAVPPSPLAVPSGAILPYGGAVAPTGYLMCVGTAVDRSTYANLFSVIGTTYGPGDGSTTFNLPDLQQRFPLGLASSGTGSTLGSTGGSIDHTHTYSQVLNHTHGVTVTDPGHTHTQNAHSHGVTDPGHTHTQNAHSHTVTDPGHTHLQNSHTHSVTDPGHNHTQNAHGHSVTDPGHTHTQNAHSHTITDPGHDHSAYDHVGGGGSQPSIQNILNGDATSLIDGVAVTTTTGVTVDSATATNQTAVTSVSVVNQTATNISAVTSVSVDAATAVNQSGTTGVSVANATATNVSNTTGLSINSATATTNSNTTGITASTANPAGGVSTGTTASNNPPYVVVNYIIKT